ncbi:MAG: S41 family peptidase [Eubacteriales bacterium]|nr:S41 family peptidase [Eubacteriales bacterium]
MNHYRARKIAKIVAIVIAIAMVVTSFSFIMMVPGMFGMGSYVVYAATEDENLDSQLLTLKQYMEYVLKNYKDDVTYQQMINGAFTGIINSLGDPYSVYYSSSEEGDEFIESVTGEYSGIGVSIDSYNDECRIVSPISGTPAEKSGIKSGDIITHIDGIDISSKSLNEVVMMMRGEEGTKVTLTIRRDSQVLKITLIREKIKNISVNYGMLENDIGYIQITSFDNDSHLEFVIARAALEKQGAESLIIDLRNNPGGLVNTALEIANLLMPEGPITHFEQKGQIVESYYADGSSAADMPIVLLVNGGSASAAEILAGALQDSKTATLVGTTTFGKGVAQQISDMKDGGTIKLSMYYFLTPNKNRIDQKGITPDYMVSESINIDAKELEANYANFAPMNEKTKPKSGEAGLNVFGAQQRLSMLGYTVNKSGIMDEATVAAVRKFQYESRLYPYGILDYTTMQKLDKSVVEFITGVGNNVDLQLEKAIEILK